MAWFLRNSKGDCEYGSHLRGVIKCDGVNQVALILAGYCMSVDNSTNELVVSFNNYKYLGNYINTSYVGVHQVYSLLPRIINDTENILCSYQNQAGFLCGKCAKGNGLAFNSLYRKCVECKDYYLQVIVFFSLMTIFFCAGCDFPTELCLGSTTRIDCILTTICDIYQIQCRLL